MKLSKLLLTIFIHIIFYVNSHSQVSEQWARYYNSPTNGNDQVRDMAVDNSGNIYLTGISSTSTTGNDFATVKYNAAGIEQWSARFNSQAGFSDVPVSMAADPSGNVYVTGHKSLGGSAGLINTVKYNSSGVQQWIARSGDSVYWASPGAVTLDNSGNIYVGGSIKTYQTDDGSYFLAKFNSAGDSIWKRTYDPSVYPQGYGSGITNLKVDGNFIYATGKAYHTDGLFTVYTALTIIKYDLNGNAVWTHIDSLINGSDEVVEMVIDLSGNILVTCSYGLDILIFKYNSSGVRLWKKLYTGAAGSYYDIPTGIAADISGNVIVTGNSTRSSSGSSDDYVTLKYDAAGNLLWEKFYNGTLNSSDYPYDVTTDLSNNVYVTGVSYETGFDFNAITIKYNSSGIQQWIARFDGGNNENHDEGKFIKTDTAGNVFIAGFSVQSGHNEDFMAVKYSQTVGITQITSDIPSEFLLSQNYPNPFNPVTNLEFSIPVLREGSKPSFVSLKVYDLTGKEIAALVNSNLSPGTYRYRFDASALPSGVYFYKLNAGDYSEVKKMNLVK